MARKRRGAWGNALGGYRKQRRDSKGRFGSGSGGSKTKTVARKGTKSRGRAKSRPQGRNMSKGARKQQAAIAAVKPLNPRAPIKAQRQNIKNHYKVKTRGQAKNKSIQNRHRRALIRGEVYSSVGSAAGQAIAMSLAGKYGAGTSGKAVAGMYGSAIGGTVGRARAMKTNKRKGDYITLKQMNNMNVVDRATIMKRERNLRRVKTAANVARVGASVHGSLKTSGVYSGIAKNQRARRATRQANMDRAQKFGLPQTAAYSGTRIGGRRVKVAKGRRSFRGGTVYNITSMK